MGEQDESEHLMTHRQNIFTTKDSVKEKLSSGNDTGMRKSFATELNSNNYLRYEGPRSNLIIFNGQKFDDECRFGVERMDSVV